MAQQQAASSVLDDPAQDPAPTARAEHSDPGRSARSLVAIMALAVAVAVGLALWSALREGDGPVPALPAEIAEDPGAWFGRTVIVSGEVDDVVRLSATADGESGPAQGIGFTLGSGSPAEQVRHPYGA